MKKLKLDEALLKAAEEDKREERSDLNYDPDRATVLNRGKSDPKTWWQRSGDTDDHDCWRAIGI